MAVLRIGLLWRNPKCRAHHLSLVPGREGAWRNGSLGRCRLAHGPSRYHNANCRAARSHADLKLSLVLIDTHSHPSNASTRGGGRRSISVSTTATIVSNDQMYRVPDKSEVDDSLRGHRVPMHVTQCLLNYAKKRALQM